MPSIDTPDEAQSVAHLIQKGKITGDARDSAMQALRDFDAQRQTSTPAAQPAAPSGLQHFKDVTSAFASHPLTSGIGLAENALGGIGGAAGSLADALTFSNPGTHQWAYQPRTQAGQAFQGLQGQEAAGIGGGYDRLDPDIIQ